MKLKTGYALKTIKENIATLEDLVDKSAARQLAGAVARSQFKNERPDSMAFPEYLMPGKLKAALEAEDGE
jgi:hypothetical protein